MGPLLSLGSRPERQRGAVAVVGTTVLDRCGRSARVRNDSVGPLPSLGLQSAGAPRAGRGPSARAQAAACHSAMPAIENLRVIRDASKGSMRLSGGPQRQHRRRRERPRGASFESGDNSK